MAVIKAVKIEHGYGHIAEIWKWAALTEADTADPVVVPHKADKTVQVLGTINGGTIEMRGSVLPEAPAADLFVLDDNAGVAIAITDKKPRLIAQNVATFAPVITVGAGMSVDVYLVCTE